ncbi:MAG: hypothetical protein HY243_05720 [Proteobacteria bacterium]|nr:hypothetical protein [Pseudomonadota bacterium]
MHKIIAACFSFCIAAGFHSGARAGEDENKLANIHTIGVISSIGHTAYLTQVATLVFGNTEDKLTVDDWGLDNQVVDSVSKLLSSKFTVVPVTADKDAFSSRNRGILRTDPPDAYLVVYPATVQDPLFSTTQNITGLSLYYRTFLGLDRYYALAMYEVALVDARTHKIMDTHAGRTDKFSLISYHYPTAECDSSTWSETAAGLTDAQKSALQQTFSSLIQGSLPYTLSAFGLIGSEQVVRSSMQCVSPVLQSQPLPTPQPIVPPTTAQ